MRKLRQLFVEKSLDQFTKSLGYTFRGISKSKLQYNTKKNEILGGGFKYFLFSPLFGEDSHFEEHISNGLKPPTSLVFGH